MTDSRTAEAASSSMVGSSSTSWKCTSISRAVSSARSTYRPIQNNASAARLSIPVPSSPRGQSLLRLLVVGTAVGDGAPCHLCRKRWRLLPVQLQLWPRGEHPGVLGAAALAGVDDQAPFPQRHPGQPAGQHPDPLAVVD